jgi:hypothetical protein
MLGTLYDHRNKKVQKVYAQLIRQLSATEPDSGGGNWVGDVGVGTQG